MLHTPWQLVADFSSHHVPLCVYPFAIADQLRKESQGPMASVCKVDKDDIESGVELVTTCLAPDDTDQAMPKDTIYLLGDSHASNFLLPLSLAVRGKYQVKYFIATGIGLVPGRDSAVDSVLTSEAAVHKWCALDEPHGATGLRVRPHRHMFHGWSHSCLHLTPVLEWALPTPAQVLTLREGVQHHRGPSEGG